MPELLRVELLGRPRIRMGDRVVSHFRSRQTAELLGFVALRMPRERPGQCMQNLIRTTRIGFDSLQLGVEPRTVDDFSGS